MVNTENFQKFSFAIIILGIFIVVFYSLLPLYLFPNSGLQLVDAITLLLFIVAFFNKNKLPKVIKKQVYAYIPFLVWVIIIIGIYYLAHPQNLNSLKPLLYMAYNFIILYSFTKLFYGMIDKSNYGQFFINLGLIASIFTCFLVKGAYEEAVRNALSFNNPNQLGYFSVILIAYPLLFNKLNMKNNNFKVIYQLFNIIILLAAHVFVFISLSRGAFLGVAFIDIWFIINIKNKYTILTLCLSFIFIFSYLLFINPDFIRKQLQGRTAEHYQVEGTGEDLKGRTIDEIVKMEGIEILVGMGGKLYEKGFDAGKLSGRKDNISIEVHNIFGDVLRSYGIIGLMLFSYWVIIFIKYNRVNKINYLIWGGLLIYNMTHNGIRFRSLWVLIAMIIVITNVTYGELQEKSINFNKKTNTV